MHCEQAEMLIPQFIYNELSAEDTSLVSAHLATCASCTQSCKELKEASSFLESALKAPSEKKFSEEKRQQLLTAFSELKPIVEPIELAEAKKEIKKKSNFDAKTFFTSIAAIFLVMVGLAGFVPIFKSESNSRSDGERYVLLPDADAAISEGDSKEGKSKYLKIQNGQSVYKSKTGEYPPEYQKVTDAEAKNAKEDRNYWRYGVGRDSSNNNNHISSDPKVLADSGIKYAVTEILKNGQSIDRAKNPNAQLRIEEQMESASPKSVLPLNARDTSDSVAITPAEVERLQKIRSNFLNIKGKVKTEQKSEKSADRSVSHNIHDYDRNSVATNGGTGTDYRDKDDEIIGMGGGVNHPKEYLYPDKTTTTTYADHGITSFHMRLEDKGKSSEIPKAKWGEKPNNTPSSPKSPSQKHNSDQLREEVNIVTLDSAEEGDVAAKPIRASEIILPEEDHRWRPDDESIKGFESWYKSFPTREIIATEKQQAILAPLNNEILGGVDLRRDNINSAANDGRTNKEKSNAFKNYDEQVFENIEFNDGYLDGKNAKDAGYAKQDKTSDKNSNKEAKIDKNAQGKNLGYATFLDHDGKEEHLTLKDKEIEMLKAELAGMQEQGKVDNDVINKLKNLAGNGQASDFTVAKETRKPKKAAQISKSVPQKNNEEVTDHFESENNSDKQTAEGTEEGISDTPQIGSGLQGGIGGGRKSKISKAKKSIHNKEEVEKLTEAYSNENSIQNKEMFERSIVANEKTKQNQSPQKDMAGLPLIDGIIPVEGLGSSYTWVNGEKKPSIKEVETYKLHDSFSDQVGTTSLPAGVEFKTEDYSKYSNKEIDELLMKTRDDLKNSEGVNTQLKADVALKNIDAGFGSDVHKLEDKDVRDKTPLITDSFSKNSKINDELKNSKGVRKDLKDLIKAEENINMKRYDIRDLTVQINDFAGPDASLNNVEIGKSNQKAIEQYNANLKELIKTNVAKDSWDDAKGTSIELFQGRLIINHTEEVQKQVETFLEELRENAAKVEAEQVQEEVVDVAPAKIEPKKIVVNPFVNTTADALSTFSIDTDSASYYVCRQSLQNGVLPQESVVRPEEFVNAFDYNYCLTGQKTFAITTDCMRSPLNSNLHILKVGIKGKVLGRDGRKPVHVVLVVDTSGSMAKETRLPMVKKGIEKLVTNMQPGDHISLVTYGSDVTLNLEYMPIENIDQIQAAVEALKTGGSTDLAKGVMVGYQIAATHFKKGAMNQVMICSDGVANVGHLEADKIIKKVEAYKKQGVSFTSIGFGSGDYNDLLLEKLALRGDGFYYYVNCEEDVGRVFGNEIGASFSVIAKDVKLQVAFKENRVLRYRLIGYEAREVKDKDFRNNAVDGGEIISGKSVTAIYELELARAESAKASQESLGTVTVRFQNVENNQWEEDAVAITGKIQEVVSPRENPYFYLGYCAATFAEIMRKSPYVKPTSIGQIEEYVKKIADELVLNDQVKDLLKSIQAYEKLNAKE